MLRVKKEKIEVINTGFDHYCSILARTVSMLYSFIMFALLSYFVIDNFLKQQYTISQVFLVLIWCQIIQTIYVFKSTWIQTEGIP